MHYNFLQPSTQSFYRLLSSVTSSEVGNNLSTNSVDGIPVGESVISARLASLSLAGSLSTKPDFVVQLVTAEGARLWMVLIGFDETINSTFLEGITIASVSASPPVDLP